MSFPVYPEKGTFIPGRLKKFFLWTISVSGRRSAVGGRRSAVGGAGWPADSRFRGNDGIDG